MTIHVPVLPAEVLQWMLPEDRAGEKLLLIDGTLGGGGHTRSILERLSGDSLLFSVDRDPDAVEETSARLSNSLTEDQVRRWEYGAANYADLPEICKAMQFDQVADSAQPLFDGILLDLGLSSDQLEDFDRGFSFRAEGPLDLRFDRTSGEPAWRLVNRLGEKHLANLIYEFGEERFSRRVARKICAARHDGKIETAAQLADIVRRCIPRSKNHSIDPATRTFQALRIAVNEELKWLKVAMDRLPALLRPGVGRMCVISFHSLEDRIVKQSFNGNADLDVLTRRPVKPGEAEIDENPRSRSARMRVAQRRTV